MTPQETSENTGDVKASLAAPHGSAARLIERGRVVGHETTLHVFQSRKRCEAAKSILSGVGAITEIFVNNRHAFECKLWRTGPVEAESLDTYDAGLVTPNESSSPTAGGGDRERH